MTCVTKLDKILFLFKIWNGKGKGLFLKVHEHLKNSHF